MSFELKERRECPYCRAPRDFNQQYAKALDIINEQRIAAEALVPIADKLGQYIYSHTLLEDVPEDVRDAYLALRQLSSPKGAKAQSVALDSPDQAKRELREIDRLPGQAKGEGSSGAATSESVARRELDKQHGDFSEFIAELALITPAPPKPLEWADKINIIAFVRTWLYDDDRSPFKQPPK